MNKKIFLNLSTVVLTAVFLSACGSQSEQDNEDINEEYTGDNEESSNHEEASSGNVEGLDKDNIEDTTQTGHFEQDEKTAESSSGSEEKDPLSAYSEKEIEYARVWLEVVGNKDIDTLNVTFTSEEESVNPYEPTSIRYPKGVVYMFTDYLAGGNVYYSSNGDGSIKLYDFPTRWPSSEQVKEERNQTMEEYLQEIIDNSEIVTIDVGDDEEVESIIQKIEILD